MKWRRRRSWSVGACISMLCGSEAQYTALLPPPMFPQFSNGPPFKWSVVNSRLLHRKCCHYSMSMMMHSLDGLKLSWHASGMISAVVPALCTHPALPVLVTNTEPLIASLRFASHPLSSLALLEVHIWRFLPDSSTAFYPQPSDLVQVIFGNTSTKKI